MQLYVPEIGDMIRLTQDWSFTLYRESRNDSLWREENCWDRVVDPDPTPVRELERKIFDIESRLTFQEIKNGYGWSLSRVKAYASQEDKDNHYNFKHELNTLQCRPSWAPVTLLKDTVLKVDRIYIRKGVSEYSSITFYVWSKSGPVAANASKKKARFWAKLADCNNIQFEKVEND
jgi:hypothetical protein